MAHERKTDARSVGAVLAACLIATLALGAAEAVAGEDPPAIPAAARGSFLRTEMRVLGASGVGVLQDEGMRGLSTYRQIAGDEIGGGGAAPEKKVESGSSNTGEKVKAGLMSAVLPGAGQFYNGQRSKAYIMGGVEVAIWTAYFVFDAQGDSRRVSSREWAAIYAGTSGDHPERYWQDVGRYMDSDAYNESVLREARALGETPTGLIGGADAWQWVNEDRQKGYSQLRADGNAAYDRRDFMILFAVVNRAVSVVDAVLNAGGEDGLLETEVLGMNLEVEMLPSFDDPGARCVISRSF